MGQPTPTLQFQTTMHVAQGFGHDGDGCLIAAARLRSEPTVSRVWFDAPGKRLAQTNLELVRPDTQPNLTFVGLFASNPPTEIDINNARGQVECQTEPLPPGICRNGSRACAPTFGGWGSLNAFTSVLGMYYLNTSFLAHASDADLWQWEWVKPTLIKLKNGSVVTLNVTRNFTYWVSRRQLADGTRPLMRYQWTQSIPLRPALPVHRDCFIFDYSTGYVPGPIDPARWRAPPGITCQNDTAQRQRNAAEAVVGALR